MAQRRISAASSERSDSSQYQMDLYQYSVDARKAKEVRQAYKIQYEPYSLEQKGKSKKKRNKIDIPKSFDGAEHDGNSNVSSKSVATPDFPPDRVPDKQADDVWIRYIDETSGYAYLLNEKTGESKWDIQPDHDSEAVEKNPGDDNFGAAVDRPGHQNSNSSWTQVFGSDGSTYYYDQKTGATAWEIPPDGHVAGTYALPLHSSRSESSKNMHGDFGRHRAKETNPLDPLHEQQTDPDEGLQSARSHNSSVSGSTASSISHHKKNLSPPRGSGRAVALAAAAAAAAEAAATAGLDNPSLVAEPSESNSPKKRRQSSFQKAREAAIVAASEDPNSGASTPSTGKHSKKHIATPVGDLKDDTSHDPVAEPFPISPENLPKGISSSSRSGKDLQVNVNAKVDERMLSSHLQPGAADGPNNMSSLERAIAGKQQTELTSDSIYPLLQRSPGGTLYRYVDKDTGFPYLFDPETGLSEWEATDKTGIAERAIVDAAAIPDHATLPDGLQENKKEEITAHGDEQQGPSEGDHILSQSPQQEQRTVESVDKGVTSELSVRGKKSPGQERNSSPSAMSQRSSFFKGSQKVKSETTSSTVKLNRDDEEDRSLSPQAISNKWRKKLENLTTADAKPKVNKQRFQDQDGYMSTPTDDGRDGVQQEEGEEDDDDDDDDNSDNDEDEEGRDDEGEDGEEEWGLEGRRAERSQGKVGNGHDGGDNKELLNYHFAKGNIGVAHEDDDMSSPAVGSTSNKQSTTTKKWLKNEWTTRISPPSREKTGDINDEKEKSSKIELEEFCKQAVVMRQRWPWSLLVDIETGKRIFRNDLNQFYQLESPPEFFVSTESYEAFADDLQRLHYHNNVGYRAAEARVESSTYPNQQPPSHPTSTLSLNFKKLSLLKNKANFMIESSQAGRNSIGNGINEVDRRLHPRSRNHLAAAPDEPHDDVMSALLKVQQGSVAHRNFEKEYGPPVGLDVSVLDALFKAIKESVDDYSKRPASINRTVGMKRSSRRVEDALKLQSRLRLLPIGDRRCAAIDEYLANPAMLNKATDGLLKRPKSAAIARKPLFEEEERKYALRSILVNDMKSQTTMARHIFTAMNGLLDESEESWIEREMNRRYMLEAAVMQRGYLVMPRSKREAVAYPALTSMLRTCPLALQPVDLLEQNFVETKRRRCWSVYSDIDDILPDIYVNNSTGLLQFGEPFDVKCQRLKRTLQREKWSKLERQISWRPGAQPSDKVRNLHLLTDEHGGFLYYCPRKDFFSFDGHFGLHDVEVSKSFDETGMKHLGTKERNPQIRGSTVPGLGDEASYMGSLNFGLYRPRDEMHENENENDDEDGRGSDNEGKEYETPATLGNVWLCITPSLKQRFAYKAAKQKQQRTRQRETKESTVDGKLKGSSAKKKRPMSASSPSSVKMTTFANSKEGGFKSIRSPSPPPSFAGGAATFSSSPKSVHLEVDIDDEIEEEVFTDDCAPLHFECTFSKEEYNTYRDFIEKLSSAPSNITPLLELVYWLLELGLGIEAFAVLQYAVETLQKWNPAPSAGIDEALTKLLLMKISKRYFGNYESLLAVVEAVTAAPENPLVLSMAAGYLQKTQFTNEAEQLFIGALLMEPICAEALRGYSHLLAENGLLHTAHRYLSRISVTDMEYASARIELAWLYEMKGVPSDAIKAAFKVAVAAGDRELRSVSLALHSLGHFYHVRGDISTALIFYDRALLCCPDNAMSLVLRSLIKDTKHTSLATFTPSFLTTSSSTNANGSSKPSSHLAGMSASAASFRRGICYLSGPTRWIALIAQAEHLVSQSSDLEQAEALLWDAAKTGSDESVWPVIALAHFYQHTRSDVQMAKRVLKRFLYKRVRTSEAVLGTRISQERRAAAESRHFDFNLFLDDNEDQLNESLRRSSDMKESVAKASKDSSLQTLLGKNIEITPAQAETTALYTALAFCLMDLSEFAAASMCAKKALRLDSRYSPANRCLGLLTFSAVDRNLFHRKSSAVNSTLSDGGLTRERKIREQQVEFAAECFANAQKNASGNPYTLRTCAVHSAMNRKYAEALRLMTTAVAMGSNHGLSWRALGIMTYLYGEDEDGQLSDIILPSSNQKKSRDKTKNGIKTESRGGLKSKRIELAISYLKRAFDLNSHGELGDVDAAIMCGQLLLETGRYEEAHACFRAAIKAAPGNHVLLASLALCVSALTSNDDSKPRQPVDNSFSHQHIARLNALGRLSDLGNSTDCDQLFEAAVIENLEDMVRNLIEKRRNYTETTGTINSRRKSMLSPENLQYLTTESSLFQSISDEITKLPFNSVNEKSSTTKQHNISPDVYYWCGLHQMRKGTAKSLDIAEEMFQRAVYTGTERIAGAPHALSLFMLGWLAELKQDFPRAEKLLSYALQLDPVNPLDFLRLLQTTEETLEFVYGLADRRENGSTFTLANPSNSRSKKKKQKQKQGKEKKTGRFQDIDLLSGLRGAEAVHARQLNGSNSSKSGGGSDDASRMGGNIGMDGDDFYIDNTGLLTIAGTSLSILRTRILLHEKVHKLALIRKKQLASVLQGLNCPGRFVYIDPFWLERLMDAFAQCDDWSWLLKSGADFKQSAAEKAVAAAGAPPAGRR